MWFVTYKGEIKNQAGHTCYLLAFIKNLSLMSFLTYNLFDFRLFLKIRKKIKGIYSIIAMWLLWLNNPPPVHTFWSVFQTLSTGFIYPVHLWQCDILNAVFVLFCFSLVCKTVHCLPEVPVSRFRVIPLGHWKNTQQILWVTHMKLKANIQTFF